MKEEELRDERLLRALTSAYSAMLVAYPARFRRLVASEMVEVFEDLCARELETRGRAGLLRFGLTGLVEALRNGLAERIAGAPGRRTRADLPRRQNPPVTPRRTRASVPARSPHLHRRSGESSLMTFKNDLKFSVRMLRKRPLFSATVVAMLALGIAGAAAIFSVFNAVVLRPLPFDDPDRLVNLDVTAPRWNLEYVGVAYPDYVAWRDENRTFDRMAVWDAEAVNLAGEDGASRIDAARVTHQMAEVLQVAPILGRDFDATDDTPGAPGVALLGEQIWRTRFAADPDVIGTVLRLDALPYTVIGVLPRSAVFIGDADIWVPLATDVDERAGSFYLDGIGRMAEGVTVAEARADLERIHKGRIEQRNVNEITSPVVQPVLERYLGEYRVLAWALMLGVGGVLLIACGNIAGMMLARATTRSRELGIRLALGAGRGRIVQQLLTESFVLSVVGVLLGSLAGWGILRALISTVPEELPRWLSLDLDARFLLFSAVVTLGSALLSGMAPALRASRTDLHGALQSGTGRATGGRTRRRALGALVVGEVALAFTLLVGAGLFIRGFFELTDVDPGFRTDGILSYALALPDAAYETDQEILAFWEEHLERVSALPGVRAAAAVKNPPLGGHSGYFFEIENAPPREERAADPVVLMRRASPDYFDVMGVTLLGGRTFDEADGRDPGAPVIVVNETFARTFFPDGEPLGRRVRLSGSDDEWMRVIGVTRDVQHYGLATPMRPGVYVPLAGFPTGALNIVAHTAVPPESIVGAVREVVREADRDLPVYAIGTMEESLRQSLRDRQATAWFFAVFATIALTLAVGGIYGVISYAVSQRSRELGIRKALGARSAAIVGQVLRQGGLVVGLGVALGLPLAIAAALSLAGVIYGVSAWDPLVYGSVGAIMLLVSVAANLVPARRAASIDPVAVLHEE